MWFLFYAHFPCCNGSAVDLNLAPNKCIVELIEQRCLPSQCLESRLWAKQQVTSLSTLWDGRDPRGGLATGSN